MTDLTPPIKNAPAADQPNNNAAASPMTIFVSKFVSKKLAIDPTATSVKLEDYTLICSPYKINPTMTQLITALSPDEVTFFRRFEQGLASLSIRFQPPFASGPLNVFCRCQLHSIAPVSGRDGTALLTLNFKPCPPDLLQLIEDYTALIDRLRVKRNDIADNVLQLQPDTVHKLGFNNYAEVISGQNQKVALFALGSTCIRFLVPANGRSFKKGEKLVTKLYFQRYQFAVEGTVSETETVGNNIQKLSVSTEFSPELIDILDSYLLEVRLAAKKRQ